MDLLILVWPWYCALLVWFCLLRLCSLLAEVCLSLQNCILYFVLLFELRWYLSFSKLVDSGSDCTTLYFLVWCMTAGLDAVVPETVDFLLILVF